MTHVVESAAERPDTRRGVHRPPAHESDPAQREVAPATARSAPPISGRSAVLLQRQAGNRATAQLLARQRKPAPPPNLQRAPAPAPDGTTSGPATASVDGAAAVQRLVAGRAGPGQDPKFAALKAISGRSRKV